MTVTRLRVATAAGLLAGFILSPKLWLSSRFFPLTPVWSGFGPLAAPWDSVAFFAVAALLVLLCIVRKPQIFHCTIAILILLALQDQSRWQPWFYQYCFMLAAIGPADRENPAAALNTCRLIIVAIYVWSGLAKLNPNFIHVTFPWLVEPFTQKWPTFALRPVHYLAFVAPLVECGIGIGLLTRRFRRAAVAVGIAMHASILLAIGPLGHRFNTVVWPWNLAMVCFLVILFRQAKDVSARDILWGSGFQKIVLVLFAIAPVLGPFDLWDHYLSAALYSGNRNSGVIYVSDDVFDRLPDAIADYVYEDAPNRSRLDINTWSFGELNVPSYPETRVYRNVARRVCDYVANDSGVELVVRTRLAFVNGNREFRWSCAMLH